MQKIVVVLLSVLLFGCEKTIQHGEKIWWQPKNGKIHQNQDNASVFVSPAPKKNYQFNQDAFQNQQNFNGSQSDVVLNQALNQNAKPSELAKQSNTPETKQVIVPTPPISVECNCQDGNKNTDKKQENTYERKNEPKDTGKKSYKIQCGYFENIDRANQMTDMLKQHGISDARIVKNGDKYYRVIVGDYVSKNEGKNMWNKISELDFIDGEFWIYI